MIPQKRIGVFPNRSYQQLCQTFRHDLFVFKSSQARVAFFKKRPSCESQYPQKGCDFTLLLFIKVWDGLGTFITLLARIPAIAMSINGVYL